MGDKEAIPVEDPEVLVTPVEDKQPVPPEEQHEVPTQTEEVTFRETLMKMIMEINKNIESTKEENKSTSQKLSKDTEENSKKLSQYLNRKMDGNNQSTKEDLSLIHI